MRARQEGAVAALTGRQPTDCPYPVEDALRLAWVRGYCITEQRIKT
ncbi:Rmf/CrpP fold protein [Streptomyces sp. NPDC003027]